MYSAALKQKDNELHDKEVEVARRDAELMALRKEREDLAVKAAEATKKAAELDVQAAESSKRIAEMDKELASAFKKVSDLDGEHGRGSWWGDVDLGCGRLVCGID